jgi:hypothetical protein
MRNDLWFISTIAQFTPIGLQKINSNDMTCAARRIDLLCSPDLAPSDFYLFPTVKEKIERIQVVDKNQFLESLHEILNRIDQDELNGVFQTWTPRIPEVSESKGDYVR